MHSYWCVFPVHICSKELEDDQCTEAVYHFISREDKLKNFKTSISILNFGSKFLMFHMKEQESIMYDINFTYILAIVYAFSETQCFIMPSLTFLKF